MESDIGETSEERTNTILVSSFLGDVIHVTYNNQGKSCSSLKAQAFRLDQLQKKFIPIGQIPSINIQTNHLQCVVHGSVEGDATGLVNLCLVVEAASSDIRWIYYVLQVTVHVIRTISKFDLSYQLSKNKVHLTAGPRVVWSYKDKLTVYNATEKLQKFFTRQSSGWIAGGSLLWSGNIGRDLVTIGTVKELQESSDDMVNPQNMLMSFQNRHHFVGISLRSESRRNPPVSKLIPGVYAEIVTVMNVINNSDSVNVIICTSESQLISFRDGQIQNICQLPFKDSVKVDVAVVTGGKELIVVHSGSSEVCCVWPNTFEVAEAWQAKCKVLVDDFCQCGSDQILMLDSRSSHNIKIFPGFILTDLQRYNIKDGTGAEMEDNLGSQSNLKSAVKALQTRMQVSVAAVKESRLKLADKVRMIHQSHKALVNMANGNADNAESTDQTASLICLFDGSAEGGTSRTDTDQVQISDQNARHPSVSAPWQSLVGDEWIVGMKVQNTTSKSLHKLALSVIARDDQHYPITLQSRSNLASLPNHLKCQEKPFDEPLLKRMKYQPGNPKRPRAKLHPNDCAFVCAVTKLPAFSRPYLVCNLLLHWKDSTVDVPQPFRSICVGNVTLLATDVASGNMQVVFQESCGSLTDQEEMTLNAVQLETMLDITSCHSNVSQVASMIQNSLKFLPMTNSNGFICKAAGAFSLCRIYITNLNLRTLKAQVFTSDEKTLLLLIHSLYNLLPDDVIITPNQSPECLNSASTNALNKLEEELTTKLQIYTDLISSQEGSKIDVESVSRVEKLQDQSEQEPKSVDDWRKEFAIKQTLSKSKSSPVTIEGQVAKQTETEALLWKLATDAAFMELSKKCLDVKTRRK